MSTKLCSTCKIDKEINLFEADSRYKSGVRSQCIECRYSNPKAKRAKLSGHLLLRYGIAIEEWEKRLSEQGGVCAICKLPESRVTRPNAKRYMNGEKPRLSMDHNHATGQARGLLCYKCNIAIGHLQDSIENLESAIRYLKKWK